MMDISPRSFWCWSHTWSTLVGILLFLPDIIGRLSPIFNITGDTNSASLSRFYTYKSLICALRKMEVLLSKLKTPFLFCAFGLLVMQVLINNRENHFPMCQLSAPSLHRVNLFKSLRPFLVSVKSKYRLSDWYVFLISSFTLSLIFWEISPR